MWIAILTPVLIGLGAFALVLAAALVYAETGLLVGFFLPGDSLLFTVGVLTAAHVLPLPIWLVLAVLVTAAVLGDSTGYAIGRRYGPRLFNRPASRLWRREHLDAAEAFIARFGPLAVVLARFLPWARTFVPVVAGAGSMPRGRFLGLNVGGALVWVVGITLTGYSLGRIPFVADHVVWVTIGLAVVAGTPVALIQLVRWVQGRKSIPTRPRVGSV